MSYDRATSLALVAMEELADIINVKGVAVVLVHNMHEQRDLFPRVAIVGGKVERPRDSSRGQDDSGTNYLAVALSKLAEMFCTSDDSGVVNADRPYKTGELGFKGGLTQEIFGVRYFAAFSGGTQIQDQVIARKGLKILVEESD